MVEHLFETSERTCTFEGCTNRHRAHDLCSSHLDQLARGKELAPIEVPQERCDFAGCGNRHKALGLCRGHYEQQKTGKPLTPLKRQFGIPTKPYKGRYLNGKGYAIVKAPPEHPNAQKNGWIAEHVLVMSELLGRPLVRGEEVHHKNGARDDNRPENLELWNTRQPKGQRAGDKVRWAREILELYGDAFPE